MDPLLVLNVPRGSRLRADLANLDLDEIVRRELLVRAMPPDAVLCRRSAARLHGIDLLMPDERSATFGLDVAVPVGREPLSREGVTAHVCDLLPKDVVLVDGLPVTSLDRTLLDVARFLSPPLALAILDRAAAAGILPKERLLDRLTSMKGQRWVAKARRLVDLADAGAESPGESWCRLRVADAGFDRTTTQIPIARPDGRLPFRLDMGWPERRRAVEYDGVAEHDGAQKRLEDAERRAYIRSVGWEVLVVGKGEVLGRSQDFERAVGELLGLPWNGRPRRW